MTDNTVLNPGSGGDTYASDDIGGIKHTRVKLIHGIDGVNNGDVALTNPLPVSALGFPKTIKVNVTRFADTAVYAAGDAISNHTSTPTTGGFTITGAGRQSGGSCLITDVVVTSDNDPATRLAGEILIFDTSVTNINDNAVFGVTDAEIKTCIGIIPFSLFDSGNNGMAHVLGLNMLCTCSGSADLRFLLRARNAYTPASGEVLSFTFKLLQLD